MTLGKWAKFFRKPVTAEEDPWLIVAGFEDRRRADRMAGGLIARGMIVLRGL